ncbi:MAG: type II toxin-antitoxin system VapC family toxin [Gammaproteobacteria bacterium]|nr:type II toxin-antitoxin system VapC family toxin [Gammaproteobacteria bacterium]
MASAGYLPGRRATASPTVSMIYSTKLFEDRIVDWSLDDARACARITEDRRRRGEPLDDHLPDAFLAAPLPPD